MLTQSTTRLAEAVLPAGTPAVAAIPAAMRSSDIDASRERLQGSIVKCNNGDMFVVPTTGGLKLARGKILRISTAPLRDGTFRQFRQPVDETGVEIATEIPAAHSQHPFSLREETPLALVSHRRSQAEQQPRRLTTRG